MCPHTAIYVSSFYYICVLILQYMCPHTGASGSNVTLQIERCGSGIEAAVGGGVERKGKACVLSVSVMRGQVHS